jgi:pyruvate dehydrogenase E1 component beta subunit
MDYTILKSVKKNKSFSSSQAWPFVASEITYIVQERVFDYLDAPIQRITTADTQHLPCFIKRVVTKWMMLF